MVPGAIFSHSNSPSSPTDIDRMRKVPYREAISSLMYASITTRPNISFAMSTLSQFLDNPGDAHWIGVKHIFHYLAGMWDVELTYGAEHHDLVSYTDADGTMQEHRHAISGNAFLINGGAISWSSRKQELITLSMAEAEYVATTHAAKEALWLRKLIHKLFPSLIAMMPLYCNNQAAIKLIEDDNYHARTKHIDVWYHFIQYTVQSSALNMIYCPTEDMVANILTKVLPKWKTTYHNTTLGLWAQHTWGGVMGRLAARGEMEEHTHASHSPQKPNLFHPCLGDLSCLFLNITVWNISILKCSAMFETLLLHSKLPHDPQNAYQIVEQMPSIPGLPRHVWLHICSRMFAFMSYLYFCFSTLQTKVLITICADVTYLYKNHSMTA